VIRTCSQVNQLILWFRSAQLIWFVSLRLNWRFRFVPIVWQIVNIVVFLCQLSCFEFTLIRWRVLFGWIIVGIEVFTLPICAHKSASLFKVSCKVNVLLLAKYFCFYSRACLRPLVQNLLCLFVPSFLLKFSILMFEPNWLKFLLYYVVRWIIVKVRWTTFESILSLKLYWLLSTSRLIRCVESFKWFCPNCFFWLVERGNIRGASHSFVISKSSTRHVKRISNVREHKASLVRLARLKQSFLFLSILRFTLLDFINTDVVIFEFFSIEILNSNICGGNVFM